MLRFGFMAVYAGDWCSLLETEMLWCVIEKVGGVEVEGGNLRRSAVRTREEQPEN